MEWSFMDPYIDPERLDPRNPFYERKLDNLRRGDAAHRDRAEVLEALPAKLTLQTTDVCNLDCPHCQIPRAQKTPRMDARILERVVAELFPTLIELHPTNLGEPLTWPLFSRLCREMASHGVLLDLTTNGTLLTPERIAWLHPIARDVKVSFDGAVRDTFERLRRGARFDAVCANVRELVKALEDAPARPVVALQMTLMRSNYRELPALVRLAAELGAHRVKAYHLFSFTEEMDGESLMHDLSVWPPVLEEALREGERLGIELQCAEPEALPGAPWQTATACHLPWHETWVDVDGAVLACHSHGGEAAGNLLSEPFARIWNGPLYRRIRRGFAVGRLEWNCDGCGMNCQKTKEHEAVPYDQESFFSPEWRQRHLERPGSPVRWSGRMRQFDLKGRRHGR
jgi:MoaA/NifB/PqqE/SkfB family radical SAM enzyme